MTRTLLTALLAFSLAACSAEPPPDRNTLWRVSDEDSHLYLLGSVHALRERDYPLPEAIEAAWRDSEILVLELDPAELDPDRIATLMRERGFLPRGVTLADVMAPEDLERARELAEKADIDLGAMANFEPWLAALVIVNQQVQAAGFDPEAGLDRHLGERAVAEGRALRALETADEQLTHFDTLAPDLQSRFLLLSLEDADDAEEDLDDLVEAWRRGDIETLEALLSEGFDEMPELYAPLVEIRNTRWMAQLEPLLAGQRDVLVVVGALHLVGEDGLVERFDALGYEVEQL